MSPQFASSDWVWSPIDERYNLSDVVLTGIPREVGD